MSNVAGEHRGREELIGVGSADGRQHERTTSSKRSTSEGATRSEPSYRNGHPKNKLINLGRELERQVRMTDAQQTNNEVTSTSPAGGKASVDAPTEVTSLTESGPDHFPPQQLGAASYGSHTDLHLSSEPASPPRDCSDDTAEVARLLSLLLGSPAKRARLRESLRPKPTLPPEAQPNSGQALASPGDQVLVKSTTTSRSTGATCR